MIRSFQELMPYRSAAAVSSTALHDIAGTSHLNRGVDGDFEIVRVVSRRFVSIAKFTR